MYNREVLEKLEYLMMEYETKIYREEDVERAYMSLRGFNELHKSITGKGLFDKRLLKALRPNLYNSAIQYNEFLNENMLLNLLSLEKFTLEEIPEVIDFLNYNLDRCNIKEKIVRDIPLENTKDFINSFLKHSIYVKDIDIFNVMCAERRIVSGILKKGYKGMSYFDFCGNNDYILIGNNNSFSNYSKCCSAAHELGHIEDVMYLSPLAKTVYAATSAFIEVPGHTLQNFMYDFILNYIEPDVAKYFKYKFLEDLSDKMNNTYLSFEYKDDISDLDLDPFNDILYAYGKMMSIYLTNCNIEELGKFNRLHYNFKDSSLLTRMNINKDKMIKVLSKEFEKINR